MNRCAAMDAVGATGGVVELPINADSQAVEDRCREILRGVGVGCGQSTMSVGLSDDPAGLDAAACEPTGENVPPVVTAWCERLA